MILLELDTCHGAVYGCVCVAYHWQSAMLYTITHHPMYQLLRQPSTLTADHSDSRPLRQPTTQTADHSDSRTLRQRVNIGWICVDYIFSSPADISWLHSSPAVMGSILILLSISVVYKHRTGKLYNIIIFSNTNGIMNT